MFQHNTAPDFMRFTERERGEIYNALADRINALKVALLPELPVRVRASLLQSLADCQRLVEGCSKEAPCPSKR